MSWIGQKKLICHIQEFTLNYHTHTKNIEMKPIVMKLETITSVISMTFFRIYDSFKFNDYMFYPYILCVSVVVESETGL